MAGGITKSQEALIRIAVAEGAKAGIEAYKKEKQKAEQRRAHNRVKDTKRLLKNYREIKLHAGNAVASLSEINNEDYDFFRSLMEDRTEIDVKAITASRARSCIMLTHIESMLSAYETICMTSKRQEEQRRYRVLEEMYLLDEPLTAPEIAEREYIDCRTVYRDLDEACEKMSALLFGIQWIERE